MTNSTGAIAQAFHDTMAQGGPLTDDAGNPAIVSVPMAGGVEATLAYNEAAGGWTVSVSRSADQLGAAKAEELAEMLAELTGRTRFGSALIGGQTDDGRLCVSSVIIGTATEASLATVLSNGLALLGSSGQGATAAMRVDDLISEGWIRI